MYPKCEVTQCKHYQNISFYFFSLDKNLINHQEEFELGILVRRPTNKNLIGEYFFGVFTT